MSYFQTLKHPVIRRLSIIQLLSYFGSWFSQVALFSMMVSFGADAMTIALMASVGMLPAIFLAPVIGIIIERVDFKKLMFILLSIELLMTLGFIFVDSVEYIWVLMILLFFRSGAASMLFSAEMSLFPKLIEGDMLKNTNEIHSIIWSLCYALGMAAGGLATHYMGFDIAFILDALLYAMAIFMLLGLKLSLEKNIVTESNWQMFKDGAQYLITQKKILHLLILHATLGLTSFDALVTLLADLEYKSIIAVPLAIGYINAVRAIGLMIGPLFISKYISKENLHFYFILQGIAIILWSQVQGSFYISLIALFFVGFFVTTLWSYTYLLIQEETAPKFLGRIISYNDMFFMLSNVGTAMFIGYASQQGVALDTISLLLGLGFIGVAGYYLWLKYAFFNS